MPIVRTMLHRLAMLGDIREQYRRMRGCFLSERSALPVSARAAKITGRFRLPSLAKESFVREQFFFENRRDSWRWHGSRSHCRSAEGAGGCREDGKVFVRNPVL